MAELVFSRQKSGKDLAPSHGHLGSGLKGSACAELNSVSAKG
jgi:hypothetical protein